MEEYYQQHLWAGKDLTEFKGAKGLKYNFIAETVNQLHHGNNLINNGIFDRSDDDLLYCAITEMLIIVRSLGEKYRIITNDYRPLYNTIRQFRNAVCHTDSQFNTDGCLVLQIVPIPIMSSTGMPNILHREDGTIDLSQIHNTDEIKLLMGQKPLLIHAKLLAEFNYLQDFFWSHMPSEHEFFLKTQQHKQHNHQSNAQ